MARLAKSLKAPEQGYGHRDYRSPKARNWRDRVQILKAKNYKEKIAKRNERELEVEQVKEEVRNKKHKHNDSRI